MVTTREPDFNAPAPVGTPNIDRALGGQKQAKLLGSEQRASDYDVLEDASRTPKADFKPDPDALPASATPQGLARSVQERDADYEARYADPDSYRARADLAIASDDATIPGIDAISRGAHSGNAVARELQGRSSAELKQMLKNEGELQQRDPSRSYTSHVGDR